MCYIISTMKKNNVFKHLITPVILMILILTGFVIYRLGNYPTIHFLKWHGLATAPDLGESVPLENYDLSPDLMVISPDYPLDEATIPEIVEYRSTGVLMAEDITESYGQLSDYIREHFNNTLYIESSFRSFEDQERILAEEGPEIAALPGCSEHQSGLSLDVYVMYFGGSAFINSNVGKFVNTNCGDFGFIIRYPLGAENITGFKYEPWHIRYVGLPHSKIITENNITLEEYIDSLTPDTWYSYGEYIISRRSPDSLMIPERYKDNDIKVCPDNMGYVIVTIHI